MIKLTKATVHKYKCIENTQEFIVEPDVTVLVGMNESGKTSILEALAKCSYFENDAFFRFNQSHDYPRKQVKTLSKNGDDPVAVVLEYFIDDNLIELIQADVAENLTSREFTVSKKYGGGTSWTVNGVTTAQFVKSKLKTLKINDTALTEKLSKVDNATAFNAFLTEISGDDSVTVVETIKPLSVYFENINNWRGRPIDEYIMRCHLSPNLPKFMYYDDYYMLPSRVSLPLRQLLEQRPASIQNA